MRVLLFATALCGCGGTIAAGGDASSDAGADVVPLGTLYFQLQNGPPPLNDFFRGTFYANAQQASGLCQPSASAGACTTSICGSLPPPASSLFNAGTLTLSGGAYSSTTVTEGGDGNYMMGGTFSSGDVLGVSASGGKVASFAQTVVAPGMIALASPQGGPTSTANDLVFTWTGGESNAKVVASAYGTGKSGSMFVSCTFDATAGTGTMPQSFIASVAGTTGGIIVSHSRATIFFAGDYPIQLSALQFTVLPATFE